MSKLVEEWKDIKGYEGLYQVSDWGNVKSLDRVITRIDNVKQFFKSKNLKKTKDKNGYLFVALGANSKNKKIHRLVAQMFIPNPENKPEIDHIDGNPQNNNVENLQWVNRKENINNPVTIERMKQNALKQYKKRNRNELGQFN